MARWPQLLSCPMSRAPYGARGLKWSGIEITTCPGLSRPVWGAWIEICTPAVCALRCVRSRPVWGAWIEICVDYLNKISLSSRAPYGARGLKYMKHYQPRDRRRSRPVWGAWIEIGTGAGQQGADGRSRPVWGAWIEILAPVSVFRPALGRAPYGARGLKYSINHRQSLPCQSRAPYGARGLK